ncbi:MAG TPA: hypothetical protein VJN02_00575 [Gammaproteobacteria bacterium]|nr:hypothetical protein [Gammaproteobacteria bacterium]
MSIAYLRKHYKVVPTDSVFQPLPTASRRWILIFASMFILYLIFAPSLHILYYSGDDFKYSFGGISKSCAESDGYHFMLTVGRPLQTFVDCLGFKFADTLEGMRVIRIVTVMTIGMVMGLLADWLYRLGFSLGISFFAAGNLLLIAHLYGDAVPMGAISLPLTLLLTCMGYRCVNHAHQYPVLMPASRWKAIKYLGLSFIAILAALLTYPALAFFFCTLMLMKLLFSDLAHIKKTKQELLKELSLFVFACIIYFIWAYYNIHYHARTEFPAAYHVGHPNLNWLEMIKRLILLSNIFSSWWPISPKSDSMLQGWIMIVGLLGGIVAMIRMVYQFETTMFSNLVQGIIVGMGLFVLSSTFLLVMPTLDIVENRVLYAAVSSGLVLVFWGFWQWKNILPKEFGKTLILIGVASLFLIAGHQASHVTMVNALSHVQYLDETRVAIAHYKNTHSSLKRIHFIIPRSNSPYDRYPLAQAALVSLIKKNDFKLRWCAGSPIQAPHHVNEAVACITNRKKGDIVVTYSFEGEPFLKTDAMVMIRNHYRSLDLEYLS